MTVRDDHNTRFASQHSSFNQAVDQLRSNLTFFENRIEELEEIESDEIDASNSGQADIDGDNHGDDEKSDNHNDEIESQASDFDDDDVAFTKKRRIGFRTLRSNVKRTSAFSNVSSRTTESNREVEKLRNMLLQKNNEVLQLKIQLLKSRHVAAGHRREHNDDHYRLKNEDYRRNSKRASRLEKLKQQAVINYSDFMNWIADCERYIEFEQPENFRIERKKIDWAASILAPNKRQKWYQHKDILRVAKIFELDWYAFVESLKTQLSNSKMRTYECEIKLKKAKQRETQFVSDFV